MEASQTRLSLGLGGALVVVVGLLALTSDPDPTDPEGDDVPLWQVAPDTIVAVELERALPDDGQRERRDLALEQRAAGWFLTEPFQDRADDDAVRALFRLLALQHGEAVEEAMDPSEYGLGDPPLVRVTVHTKSGLERELWVGAKVPTGYRTYVRVPDGPVLTVAGDGHRVVTERVESFRDHRMLRVDPAMVRHVELFGPDGRLVIDGQGRSWGLEGWGRVEPNAVDDVVMGLLDLRYDLIWEQDTWVEDPEYGAVVREEGGESVRLHVGRETPMGRVASTSDGRYGLMFPELVKQLGRGPTSVLDPDALPIDMERADAVRVELGGASVQATRNGPEWTIPGVDPAAAWGAVSTLAEAPAVYRFERPEGPFDAGRVEIREGDRTLTLRLGPVVDGLRAVVDDAHPWAYRMSESDLQAFVGVVR